METDKHKAHIFTQPHNCSPRVLISPSLYKNQSDFHNIFKRVQNSNHIKKGSLPSALKDMGQEAGELGVLCLSVYVHMF